MIPTSATNSPTATAAINNSSGGVYQINANSENGQNHYTSTILGIASLILEGRPISDDEYQTSSIRCNASDNHVTESTNHYDGSGSNGGYVAIGGQTLRSAIPRTVATSASGSVINITTNPYVSVGSTNATVAYMTPTYSNAYVETNTPGISGGSTSKFTENTHQRWTQKLCQLRQISPAAQSITSEPELVALAINDHPNPERTGSDFEIVRRVMLNRANLTATTNTSNATTPANLGSENILHSLQSLATTCLRGSSPTLESSPLTTSIPHYSPTPPPPTNYAPFSPRFPNCSYVPTTTTSSLAATLSLSDSNNCGKSTAAKAKPPKSATTTRPQHGPHCDQFLRKMGLAKGEVSDAEEHFCDMTYVNITCSRWRAFCLKIGAISGRKEPICIEVYLGPVAHKILLEQWIINVKEKMPPPTMTLPSLCSAIRSQLYFSQIVAWCDLLRKSDKSIYETGRIIFSNTIGSAGDLVMPLSANITPSTSPSANATSFRRPRLNIFYRIKQYDSMACFNTKPNIHNFPSVNINDSVSISVCVKSLPRINGGIPKVVATPTMPSTHSPSCSSTTTTTATSTTQIIVPSVASTPTNGGVLCAATPNGLAARTTTTTTTTDAATPRTSRLTQYHTTINNRRAVNAINNCDTKSHNASDDTMSCDKYNKDEPDYYVTQANGYGTVNCALLSHREKQLQKYRKRMLKRDKKRDRKFFETNNKNISDESFEQMASNSNSRDQPMDQCDEDQDSNNSNNSNSNSNGNSIHNQTRTEMVSTGTQTLQICCQHCGSVKNFVCLNCCSNDDRNRLMTKTDEHNMPISNMVRSVPAASAPSKADILLQAIQRTPKNKKTTEQLTRYCKKNTGDPNDLNKPMSPPQSKIIQNNNHVGHKVVPNLGASCQVCKRQKTQHIFSNGSSNRSAVNENDVEETAALVDSNVDADRELLMTANDASENDELWDNSDPSGNDTQIRVFEETKSSSTKLTPKIHMCSITITDPKDCNVYTTNSTISQPVGCTTPPIEPITNDTDADNLDCEIVMQFKTPTTNMLQQQTTSKSDIFRKTPKPNQLRISCDYSSNGSVLGLNNVNARNITPTHQSPHTMRKALPKVNLTPIFCNPIATNIASAQSAPIPINSCDTIQLDAGFSFDTTTLNHSQSHTKVSEVAADNIPVQKSYSAPTLPNSLSLSPRFAKQASFYKRRSRHLSDRSDRSSLGSDEQLSDDDYDGCQISPATSPLKGRFRITTQFGRQPLLGNLEESLLQKRLLPKMEVMGFKVLLGASGGFCPTQLTIPAAAFFYELHGETLSTPYLCEIRLPRKGYSVPRTGTVQATLLNPMGTVVRMFVIPYDMRDMPALHRTFIRQRILAEESPSINSRNPLTKDCNNKLDACEININTSNKMSYCKNINSSSCSSSNNNNSKLGHFITAEQMKRLRYSIHLRFQTSRSGRLSLHTDIRLLISRRTDCDTAAAHAKGVLEAPNELVTDTMMPLEPMYSARQQNSSKI